MILENPDAGTLASFASVIAAFSAAMLFFRIQRENDMRQRGEVVWLPVADWLLVAGTVLCLLLVIVPVVTFANRTLPSAAAGAPALLVAGYIPAIMAHYRIVFGSQRTGPRDNPEPAEGAIALVTSVAAVAFFIWRA